MKTFILLTVAIWNALFAGYVVCAEDSDTVLTAQNITEVKNKLEAFDKGEITLEEATEPGGEAWANLVIRYYTSHSNEMTTKMILPISRCYAGLNKFSEAATLAQKYVNVYSNDWHGWRIIAGANYLLGHFNAAVNAYTNAVRLGDDGSCAKLAFAAMKTDQDDLVRDMVPHLLALKNSKTSDKTVRPIEIEAALLLYSLRMNQKDIFMRALEGVNLKEIIAHEDLTTIVNQGCKQFKGEDIDRIRKQMEDAKLSNSNSGE